ncbi:hypothetical protein EHQ12_12560 [Leptospira gomenensis]|uniref:Uncharacterized protein n=1 Tax=Leptospira gomenensis TaxID=2484974 RepID=A0A5F1YQL3_9LEPT|nr:hypothetical protein [Leptospira gomenensis]TGK32763.1 hypothetical protein EHQ17_12405 [Leptospira gomenensis]TGK36911.1 hypothetical protein EHQ12_12560 [Leptospira gomenensis]TGK44382.1 hypothetical protein EHQ07_11875 [Leptospira gomenensis]TGK58875.1 hypothetical protein EHQ13_13695 [Leptospira gomenensis]
MSDWKFENEKMYKLTKSPYRFSGVSGCLILFLFLFVSVVALIATGYSLSLFLEGKILYPSLIVLLGFSFIYLLLSSILAYRKTKHFVRVEELDSRLGTFTIRETERPELRIALEEYISYKIRKRIVSGRGENDSDNGYRKFWDLFLVKNDGSFYLLESYSTLEELKKEMPSFRSIFPLPVSADPKTGMWNSDRTPLTFSAQTEKIHSKFLKLLVSDSETIVEISKPKTLNDKFKILLVIGIFYGVWGAIASSLSEPDPVFLFFFVPFSVLFLGIFSVGLTFIMTRNLELSSNSNGLRIRYKTWLPILSRILYLERFFPKHVVRHVRSNRIQDGQDILIVALKKNSNKTKRGILEFLFNLQAVPLKDYLIPGDEELLGIWHLLPWIKESPGFADLLAAESAIEERLGLEEEKIGFEDLK